MKESVYLCLRIPNSSLCDSIQSFDAQLTRYLGFEFVFGSVERAEVIAEIRHAHQEHCHDAFHRRRHRIRDRVVDALRSVRVVKRQEYNIIRCKEIRHLL